MRVVVAAALLVGCGSASDERSDPGVASHGTATPAAAVTSEEEAAPAATDGGTAPDATDGGTASPASPEQLDPATADAVFLTAVDEVVAGSGYEGVVDADPGGFLVLATTICELLLEGADPEVLLDATLEVVGATEAEADPALATLGGGIVGAAVEVYCPSQGDRLGDVG